jgi:hypothetical protein
MTDGARARLNALNGSTVLGLALAAAGRAGEGRAGPRGLRLRWPWRWPVPAGAAFTVGDVVVLRRPELAARPALLAHEERHARQWAVLGPAFLPLYLVAVVWSWVRAGDWWSRNPFERRAGLADGGYAPPPARGAGTGRTA